VNSPSRSFYLCLINISAEDIPTVCDSIEELVDIAMMENVGIYGQEIATIRGDLERAYQFRFTTFRDPISDGYITDMSHDEQYLFALFISEMIRSGCGELPEPAFYVSPSTHGY